MDRTASKPTVSDAALATAAVVAIVAPLAAILIKLPTGGWLLVAMVFSFPIWLLGYAVVLMAAVSMLRRRGALRQPGHRARAVLWAWLTSVGVLIVGLTVVDGGDTAESVASTLGLMLGLTGADNPFNDASMVVAGIAAIPWFGGVLALLIEWMVAVARRRMDAPRGAAPHAVPPQAPAPHAPPSSGGPDRA